MASAPGTAATCECTAVHPRRRVVLTGGPGAGKTAVLELLRHTFCSHVAMVPEAAGIVFGGGFPRRADVGGRRAAQRVIYHVQLELESLSDEANPALVVCDRGIVDGFAYWPGPNNYWSAVGTTPENAIARYDAVIHLRTPGRHNGYGHQNPLRTETAAQAAAIDARIAEAWSCHPRRFEVDASYDFLAKAGRALELIRNEIPVCCRGWAR